LLDLLLGKLHYQPAAITTAPAECGDGGVWGAGAGVFDPVATWNRASTLAGGMVELTREDCMAELTDLKNDLKLLVKLIETAEDTPTPAQVDAIIDAAAETFVSVLRLIKAVWKE